LFFFDKCVNSFLIQNTHKISNEFLANRCNKGWSCKERAKEEVLNIYSSIDLIFQMSWFSKIPLGWKNDDE